MDINVNISKQVFNRIYIPYLETDTRYEIFYGGAGSGKSHFVAQKKVYQHLDGNKRKTLVVRKVAKTIRHSTFALVKQTILDWKLDKLFKLPKGKSNFDIESPNGSQFIFTGLDDVEKLKSIVGITDIWIEEASELTEDDFTQLDLRMRGKTQFLKQITQTFNPISALMWQKKRFFDTADKNVTILKTTYMHNRFLDDEYIEMVKNLEQTDYYHYTVYALGNFGTLGNLILTNFVVEDISQKPDDYDVVLPGIDFGYNHPAAYLDIGYKDGHIYVFNEIYERKLSNDELIAEVKNRRMSKATITGDSAEPARIKEFNKKGVKMVAAVKGPDSVKASIDWLRRSIIHIHPSCVNTIKEIQSWKYREDKHGNVLEEPVPINDDAMAALRYGVEPLRMEIEQLDPDAARLISTIKVHA